jgi:hypothetical protein
VLFTGAPVDYKKELLLAFGDYVEVYDGTKDTSRYCSFACVALSLVGNASGSWALWKIETRIRERRTNMVKFVTSDLIKQAMNVITKENNVGQHINKEEVLERIIKIQQPAIVSESEEVPDRDPDETKLNRWK